MWERSETICKRATGGGRNSYYSRTTGELWICNNNRGGVRQIASCSNMPLLSDPTTVTFVLMGLMMGGRAREVGTILQFATAATATWRLWTDRVAHYGRQALRRPFARPSMVEMGQPFTDWPLWAFGCFYKLVEQAQVAVQALNDSNDPGIYWGRLSLVGCIKCGTDTGSWCDECDMPLCTRCDDMDNWCPECNSALSEEDPSQDLGVEVENSRSRARLGESNVEPL